MSGRPDWRGKWERLIADSKRQVRPETLPFPTDAQLDLIKAALLPAEQAAPAWRRWKARGLSLDTVGDASFRLLGRLWANRDAAAIGAEDLGLLKGVYRQSFADNVAKLTAALDAAQIIVDAGIPVLFFKGAALIATCDATLGLRRIADVDILVPERDAERAAASLIAAGYQPAAESLRDKPANCRIGHARSWRCPTPPGYEIDLHWWAFKPAGDDSPMFETARDATLLERQILVPSATESLLVAVANAFWREGPPLRWIVDSLLLFQAGPIDWDALLQRANRPGVLPGLTAGLGYLVSEFGAPVPAAVLDELRRQPISWRARVAHWAVTNGTMPELTRFEDYRAHGLHYPGRLDHKVLLLRARAAARFVALLIIRYGNRLVSRARAGRSATAQRRRGAEADVR